MMEGTGTTLAPSPYLVNSLAILLDVVRREIERDREVAKASLAVASSLLQSEIERNLGAKRPKTAGLATWQASRVRAFIDKNSHRPIYNRDLCFVAGQSAAHFSRSFKLTFGEPPHAYLVKRRLERVCHLMIETSVPLTEIALSAGFSDHAHLCKHFRRAFGQSPGSWRREHRIR
jgi:AraC-like DNA-binding protein